jgi:ubiquinone/menaquinone biosynthesis C-methylase UbiE
MKLEQQVMAQTSADRWFSDWFNDDYLTLYAHRTAGEARSVADLLAARLPEVGGGRTLDLACGAGRHLPFLGERQPTVGLDLSPWLLGAARKKLPDAALVRADMRTLPFRDRAFTLVASLFTSFGYFCDDAENRHVLSEMSRVVEPGGWLVLDFLNASYTRRTLIPFERTRLGEEWVQQERTVSSDGRFVSKTIHMETSGREFLERVRLFEPWDLMAMLTAAGFEVTDLCGDYHGGGWTAASPRAIVIARRHAVESAIVVRRDQPEPVTAVAR